MALGARLGFEPRCQRVTHSRDQEPRRSERDDLCVDQHQIGVLAIDAGTFDDSFVRVDHRQRTARGIAGGDRRAVHDGQIQIGCRCTRGIENFSTAGSYNDLGLVCSGGLLDSLDFSQRAFTAELMNRMGDSSFRERALPCVGEQSDRRRLATISAGPLNPNPAISAPRTAVAFLPCV